MAHEYRPWPYYKWYIEKFGAEKMDELWARSREITHYTNTELYEMLQQKKAELKALGESGGLQA